ncbi:histidine phosphatase family protein [Flavivirga aquatica]|uniref:Histidine phosphatase family protein n=1 Tax=Flavivirga aquatica TaxID=1849968 RepID=A0A1E5TAI7_9FLAO|nr:histidine phosphatase family protein [Flavivirga aquatica]OEK08392.1 histidine phosphatase family protein [Flavivirga aquatica]
MKKIILIRHAKSSWKYDVIDHERPLNKRGYNDAELVSNYFIDNSLEINMVMSSDAVRAKTTAKIFINNLNINEDIVHYDHKLYDFAGNDLIEVIKSCDNSIDNLMIFGHNHAITAFVNTYGSQYIENVPTCGIVIIQFDIKKWNDLILGKTIKTIFPSSLK